MNTIKIDLGKLGVPDAIDIAMDEWPDANVYLELKGFNRRDLQDMIKYLGDEEAWGKDTFASLIKEIEKIINEVGNPLDDFFVTMPHKLIGGDGT